MLTPQQIEEARKKIGINTVNPSKAVGGTLLNKLENKTQTRGQDIKSDFLGIGEDIISGSQKRAENIQEIKAKMESGDKGNIPGILETAGQLAGAGSDAIGSVFKGGIKMVLGPKAEEKVKELVTSFGQEVMERPEVQKVVNWYNELPEDKKDAIDAVGGFASLASDFIGVGTTQKVAKSGTKLVREGAEQVAKSTGDVISGTKKIAGEIVPSPERIVNYQVTRALDLTQGDIKNIAKSTGNEVGEFLADKNLIGGNKAETQKLLQDFYDTNYKTVREEIGKVTKKYNQQEIPRYKQALQEIKKQVGETTGLEEATKEIDSLLKKKIIKLEDVQRAKELLDEHFSLYKVTGDVKEGVQKTGLSNLRKDLKQFIEKEVKDNTGSDIASLNNDVSTSRSTLNAIETRSTRGLTASNIKIGDLGVFGVGSAIGSPILGVGAVIAKKILESSAIRLRIARYLDRISDTRKLKIKNALIKGEMPKEIVEVVESQSNLTPKIQTKNIKTQNVSISPNSTTKTLKGKGTIPENSYKQYSPELRSQIKKEVLNNENKAVIIDTDTIKKRHPNYDPKNPMVLHEESSSLSKELYQDAISQDKSGVVKFIGGGAGSGKSEVILTKIKDKPAVIFDGTMSGFDSAVKKIDYAISNGKKVEIYPVYTPIELATLFNKMRVRNVSDKVLLETHFGMRETIPKLMEKYGNKIKVIPYENKVFDTSRKYMGEKSSKSVINNMKVSMEELKKSNQDINDLIETKGIEFVKSIINDIM